MPRKPSRPSTLRLIKGQGPLAGWRTKLRDDRTPGWRLRTVPSARTMHYFLTLPDGSFNTICSTRPHGRGGHNPWGGGGAGVPIKPEKWIYPAKKYRYMARKKYPCDNCLAMAPVKPPKCALPRPVPKHLREKSK